MADNKEFPKSFKLAKAGDTATVRFLHTSVKTIEKVSSHWVQKGETWKHFRCLGEGCPACASGNQARERAYIRLFNYDNNELEVWDRTANAKFFELLSSVEQEWNGLNATAIKITRDSDEFPTYSLSPCPPSKYPVPDIPTDQEIAYRMVGKRTADDIKAFLTTGVMPPKPQKTENKTAPTSEPTTYVANKDGTVSAPAPKTAPTVTANTDDEDLPF